MTVIIIIIFIIIIFLNKIHKDFDIIQNILGIVVKTLKVDTDSIQKLTNINTQIFYKMIS